MSDSPAHKFNLYGWQPNLSLSDDENYMDIVFLITRSSAEDGQQGHMGALVVRPPSPSPSPSPSKQDKEGESDDEHQTRIFQGILGAATNTPLFGEKDCTSDIHAEITALGEACRSWQSTEGCTAYITIPPCKRCFAALVTFGVRRIVTRQLSPAIIRETAGNHGIEVVNFDWDMNRRQMQRVNRLVNKDQTDEQLMEIVEKNRRIRQQRKLAKKSSGDKQA
jgi:tRNA(Arg) A34 adenosine deaminase TadA